MQMHAHTNTYTRTAEVKEIALLPNESHNWHDQTRSMCLSGFCITSFVQLHAAITAEYVILFAKKQKKTKKNRA